MLTFLSCFLLFISFARCHTVGSLFALPKLNKTAQASGFQSVTLTLNPASVVSQSDIPIPSVCASYTGLGKECTQRMAAINVTFADCGASYTICRCSDAELTLQESITSLAKIPIGLRRYVGTLMVMLGGAAGAHAYTWPSSGEIHIFGRCSERTWIHEATHAADGTLDISTTGTGPWADAVAKDTCVPDTYSLSNVQEDLAQVSVIKVYMMLNGGELPSGFQSACMQHQLDYVNSLALYDPNTFFGNTCAFSPPAHHDLAPSVLTQSNATLSPTKASPAQTAATSSASVTSGARHYRVKILGLLVATVGVVTAS